MRICSPVLVLLILLTASCGQTIETSSEEDFSTKTKLHVAAYTQNKDFSGIVAISVAGELLVDEPFGFADVDSQQVATLDTSFHIASLSKTFTAAAIRILIENRQLGLEDPVSLYLPDFPRGQAITIRHLLAHQSGIPDYWSLPDAHELSLEYITVEDLVSWLGQHPLEFEPGSQSRYSNSGYALLAAIIERASDLKYHDYIQKQITGPAELSSVREFGGSADAIGYEPSYSVSGVTRNRNYNPSILIGAGSLKSSTRDLVAWCQLNIVQMKNSGDPFTYGWGERKDGDLVWLEQTGRVSGFASHIRAYPETETCIVVLSNIESDAVSAIGKDLFQILSGGSLSPPNIRSPHTVDESQLSDYVGWFEIQPGQSVEIVQTNNGLMLRGLNGPFLPLEPTEKDVFFYRQLYVEIEAHRGGDGSVDALLWGREYPMPRIDANDGSN